MLFMAKLIARLFLLLTFGVFLIHAGAQTAPGNQTAPSAQTAAPPDKEMSPELTAIKTMLNNIGYATTDAESKRSVEIKINGKYEYPAGFSLTGNKKTLLIYTTLMTLKPEQIAKFPFVKALEFDDSAMSYFSMTKTANGSGEVVYRNAYLEVSSLTPQLLRETIDAFRGNADESDIYWNPELWK